MKENVFLNCAIKEIKKIGQAVKKVEKLMTKKDNSLWEGIKKKRKWSPGISFCHTVDKGC